LGEFHGLKDFRLRCGLSPPTKWLQPWLSPTLQIDTGSMIDSSIAALPAHKSNPTRRDLTFIGGLAILAVLERQATLIESGPQMGQWSVRK